MRLPMRKVENMHITKTIHVALLKVLSCTGNAKVKKAEKLFERANTTAFRDYVTPMSKCKNLGQWKARALSAGVPAEGALALRTPIECVTALMLQYIYHCQAGDPISASLESRDKYVDESLTRWLSQA